MRKLLIAALAVAAALVAVPASASVQNIKISGSVDSTFLRRTDFEFNRNGSLDFEQNLFLTQAILRVDADLTDQVAATIALINERVWEADPANDEGDVDLFLAYVTLREMLYSPLTVVVGRQVFSYGNSFIFDATGPNTSAPAASGIATAAGDLTKQTALDAFRAILDYNPLTVEFFYSQTTPDGPGFGDTDSDISVSGVNVNYQVGDDMNSEVETYFFKKVDKSTKVVNAANTEGHADVVKVVGLRGSTNPFEGLNIQAEYAHQFGSQVTGANNLRQQERKADAVQAIVNYQIPAMQEYKPIAQYVFTKVTGDSSEPDAGAGSGDRSYNGWDPFFEAQGGGTIYNSLFSLTDLIIHSFSLQASPMEDVTAKVSVHGLWKEKELNRGAAGVQSFTLLRPDGGTAPILFAKAGETFLGKEIDLDLTYDYTEDVSIGASFGYFLPGTLFDQRNDNSAKQVLVNLNVAF